MANYTTNYNGQKVEITQERLAKFLKDNPGDIGRVGSAFYNDDENLARAQAKAPTPTPTPTPAPTSTPTPAVAAPVPPPPGPLPTSGAMPVPATPSLDAIQKVTMPAAGGGSSSSGGGISLNVGSGAADPMGIQGSQLGTLRALGRRVPPQESGSLAGIRRIY